MPALPHSNFPEFDEQMESVQDIASYFWKWDVIIALGLWATLAMQLVEDFSLSKMTLILVWPTYPWLADELGKGKLWKAYPYLKPYYDLDNIIWDNENTFHFCFSDNDPLINMDSAVSYYQNLLNGTNNTINTHTFHEKYHFGALTQFKMEDFPEIIDFC